MTSAKAVAETLRHASASARANASSTAHDDGAGGQKSCTAVFNAVDLRRPGEDHSHPVVEQDLSHAKSIKKHLLPVE